MYFGMKIGILTFHRAENFGAVLQAYALQQYLVSCGYNAIVIDYRCKSIERVYHLYNLSVLVKRRNIFKSSFEYVKRYRRLSDRKTKKLKYNDFRNKYLQLTSSVYKIKRPLDFDIYIVGSDQVWNLELLNGMNKIFFLSFPIKKCAKKISYAASSDKGSYRLFEKYKDRISQSLNDFDAISVRENELRDEMRKYTNKDITVCVDPTFLLEKQDYEKLAVKPLESKYILVYHMAETPEGVVLANEIAKTKNLKVIEIHSIFSSNTDKSRHKQNIGPLELLGYIQYSEMIITTSFHGLALSLILQKEVWIMNKTNSARLKNLLNIVGLQRRLIHDRTSYIDEEIDYSLVQEKLNVEILLSKNYIKSTLINNN